MALKNIVDLSTDQGVGNRSPTDTDVFIGESSGNVPFHCTGTQLRAYTQTAAGGNVTIVPFAAGDTRVAIQNAIDSVNAAGGGIVRLEAGRVYQVSQTGSAATFRSNTPIRYGLVMKSNVILDGNNSTIQQQNGQNAFFIVNEAVTTNPGGTGPTQRDVNMGIVNLVLDGNKANQNGFEDLDLTPPYSEQGCMALQAIDRCFIHNLEVNNSQCYGAKIVDAIECQFSELRSSGVRGDAYALGLQQEGSVPLELLRCTVGNGVVEDAAEGYSFPDSARSNIQGNPLITCCVNSAFGVWTCDNCGGGYKIENRSLDSSFDALIFVGGGPNDTANSGTKIQGFAGGRPSGITITAAISKNCEREGLRFTACDECHVGSYVAENNATAPSGQGNQDVFIEDAFLCSIGNAKFKNSQASVTQIQIQGGSDRLQFGQISSIGATVDLFAMNTANVFTQIGDIISIGGNNRIINHNQAGCVTVCSSVGTSQGSFAPDAAGGTIDVRRSDTSI